MKILLIDNYDSFTFNLYHYLSSLKTNVEVVRNDKINTKEIIKSGSLIANVSQATQSINSVDVISTPHGIGNCQLFTTNNSNGIPITNI